MSAEHLHQVNYIYTGGYGHDAPALQEIAGSSVCCHESWLRNFRLYIWRKYFAKQCCQFWLCKNVHFRGVNCAKENMMKVISFCYIVCFIFLLASCSSEQEKAMIGKWIGENESVEFLKGGAARMRSKESTLWLDGWKYKFTDKVHVRIEPVEHSFVLVSKNSGEVLNANSLMAPNSPIIYRAQVSESQFTLTGPDGNIRTYQKGS